MECWVLSIYSNFQVCIFVHLYSNVSFTCVVGLSVVCNCDISWSYSHFAFSVIIKIKLLSVSYCMVCACVREDNP